MDGVIRIETIPKIGIVRAPGRPTVPTVFIPRDDFWSILGLALVPHDAGHLADIAIDERFQRAVPSVSHERLWT